MWLRRRGDCGDAHCKSHKPRLRPEKSASKLHGISVRAAAAPLAHPLRVGGFFNGNSVFSEYRSLRASIAAFGTTLA
jgi:hypothetical protein